MIEAPSIKCIKKHDHALAVVIPAFNEARSIEAVVCQVSQRALAIVVDDGSTDATAVLAQKSGAKVVRHPQNRGYNYALETGLRTAIAMGFTFAVTMDADGQHNPILLDRFRNELEAGADLVVGQRDRAQRWSEALFWCVSRAMWGLNDPLCGIKGYRLDILATMKNFNTYDSIGTELAVRLVRGGVKVKQIPIKTESRVGLSRFGKGWSANKKICIALYNTIKMLI